MFGPPSILLVPHTYLCVTINIFVNQRDFTSIIAILLTLRRLDLGGIKRSAVSTERIWMICVRSKKARICHRTICDKSDVQDIACACYTPRNLIATAFYFDRTC